MPIPHRKLKIKTLAIHEEVLRTPFYGGEVTIQNHTKINAKAKAKAETVLEVPNYAWEVVGVSCATRIPKVW